LILIGVGQEFCHPFALHIAKLFSGIIAGEYNSEIEPQEVNKQCKN
jgi:hypothetical protein